MRQMRQKILRLGMKTDGTDASDDVFYINLWGVVCRLKQSLIEHTETFCQTLQFSQLCRLLTPYCHSLFGIFSVTVIAISRARGSAATPPM